MTESLIAGADNAQPKEYLTELVGEGKKFKDPEALAKGKYEADAYIDTLKRNFDDLRADYLKLREDNASKASLEDLVRQLQESKSQTQSSNEPPKVNDVKTPTIDPKEIESLVSKKIQEAEVTKKQQDNYNQVKDRLQELYGDKYPSVLKQQMSNLGLSEADLNALAQKSPQAFFNTMGIDAPMKDPFRNAPASTVKGINTPTQQKRTWAYYQEMKKTNPKAYYDPKTNVQMHNDYQELGQAFEDGDFHAFG